MRIRAVARRGGGRASKCQPVPINLAVYYGINQLVELTPSGLRPTQNRPVSRLAPRPASDLIVSINNPSLVIISITHLLSNCDNASLGDPPMLINGFGFKPSSLQLQ